MKNTKTLVGIKSKCCDASVHKSYNPRKAGNEEEFWCDKCDTECDFYEVKTLVENKIKEEEYDEEEARRMRLICGCPICRAVENNGGKWVGSKK